MSVGAVAEKRPLSNRQRRINTARIKAQREEEAAARAEAGYVPEREARRAAHDHEHTAPAPADGENVVHQQGISGRPVAVRLDQLAKLERAGRITADQHSAGVAYLAIVQAYYVSKSGIARSDMEAGGNLRAADPIRLYVKGRRKYVSTQKPRIIAAPRSSFDGWSGARSDAMQALGRVRIALRGLDGNALRALYALVIHINAPDKRPATLRAYVISQYGYRNQLTEDEIVSRLKRALDALWKEFGVKEAARKAA